MERVAALHRDADRLDAAAAELERALDSVLRHRRPEGWRGPAATAFDLELSVRQRGLHETAAAARHRARALRAEARELELTALGTPAPGAGALTVRGR